MFNVRQRFCYVSLCKTGLRKKTKQKSHFFLFELIKFLVMSDYFRDFFLPNFSPGI